MSTHLRDHRTAAMLGQLQRRAHGRAPLPISATGTPLVAANDASRPKPERMASAPLDHVPTGTTARQAQERKCPCFACWILLSVLGWLFAGALWHFGNAFLDGWAR